MSEEKPKSYTQKLLDRRWQQRRLVILTRDNWTCQSCQDAEDQSQLQVHHKYYLRKTEPWDYPDEALISLCKSCHKAAESYRELFTKTFFPYVEPDDLLEYAEVFSWFRDAKIPAIVLLVAIQELSQNKSVILALIERTADRALRKNPSRTSKLVAEFVATSNLEAIT